jgi:hypothetical protein
VLPEISDILTSGAIARTLQPGREIPRERSEFAAGKLRRQMQRDNPNLEKSKGYLFEQTIEKRLAT